MKYLMLIYNNPGAGPDPDPEGRLQGHVTLFQELKADGAVLSSAALRDPSAATTVRMPQRGGPATVTDGPFLEAKELLAGYYLVECESLEEATEIAGRIPCGVGGAVEIRPVDEEVTQAVRGDTPHRLG